MFERKLFLGFHVDSRYQAALLLANKQLLTYFISPNSQYLQEYFHQNQRYIGKFLASPTETGQLELVNSNIYSLLDRLVPDYPYAESPLWLFPVIEFHNPDQTKG